MNTHDQEDPRYKEYLKGEAQKISELHIAKIPVEDRNRITSAAQVAGILDLYRGKGDQLQTYDRMANMPSSIQAPNFKGDRPGTIQAMREFANNPIAHAKEVLTSYSKEGVLPQSFRTQVEDIVLMEGKNRLGEAFATLADRLDADPTGDMKTIWEQARKDLTSKESDAVRITALKQMVEAVYPDFINSPESKLWQEIGDLSREDRENPETIARLARQFQELSGDAGFAEYVDHENVRKKLDLGEIEPMDLSGVPKDIQRKLQKKMAEKFVTTEKIIT